MAANPINKKQKERIRGAERALKDAVYLMTQARNCGMDCDKYEQVAMEIATSLEKINEHFVGTPKTKREILEQQTPQHPSNAD